MALTYGFYNSIEGDRVYDAIQFGRIFDGIIKDGVYATYEKGMMVIASSNPSEVIIQPGRAWFNHTWSYNDANVIFEAPAPEVLLERYDALVLEINEELSSRENSYKWVTGTPSSRPERPTLTNTTTIHQYPLCYVHRYPETTMIYTRDITNMIGTSECPFVTGVLEGIDLDAWINQWDDEFHTWENSKKTQFEAWMLSQETAFTTWYNAFKDQMASDVQEVEDFVDYLESVLDASTAVHLQEEIDELRDEISSGSHITVTTINPELYGRNVTITESGGTVFTEKFDNTGVAVFKSVPYVGNLTISSTYGTQTAERVVNTPYYARYEFAIAFWAATVNIAGDPEMSGYSVTVKDSEEAIVGTVVLDNLGTGVYTAIKPDTYKFTLTYGGETMEVTLSVTQETTYTVDLHAAGFKWQDWLEAGGVTGSYSSLDDVLADEVALRRLFTVHASVDYLADINDENEDVEKIIGTDLAAKWINLRDYALDTLYANAIIKGYMDTADKYFYGEWVNNNGTWGPKGNVPIMTSNTAPYGTASATSVYGSGYEAFRAFDNNDSTRWSSSASDVTNGRLQYKFVNPICPKRVTFKAKYLSTLRVKTFSVLGSNDGTNWETIREVETLPNTSTEDYTRDLDCEKYYLCLALGNLTSYGADIEVKSLQFYGRELSVSVPKMDTNTTPYGEAIAVGTITDVVYKAFNGDITFASHGIAGTNTTSAGDMALGYQFTEPVIVSMMSFYATSSTSWVNNSTSMEYKIQASNDGFVSDINDLYSATGLPSDTYNIISLDNSTPYKAYRIFTRNGNFRSTAGDGRKWLISANAIQFYGKSYSEKEFEEGTNKKWLYDHGVELETLELRRGSHSGNAIEKLSASIICSLQSTPGSNGADRFAVVLSEQNFASFSLLRAKQGDNYIEVDAKPWLGVCLSTRYPQGGSMVFQNTQLANAQLTSSNMPNNISVGVTSITQSAYVEFGTGYNNGTKCELKELWLE